MEIAIDFREAAMELSELLQRVRTVDPRIEEPRLGPLDVLYFYRLFLGRMPDPEGWQFWNDNVARSMAVNEAALIFHSSDEGQARWAPLPTLVETRRGFSVYVSPTDPSVGRAILQNRDYEPNVSAFMEAILPTLRGTFVDIGSNVGWYLLLADACAPQLRLVGFEPNPVNVQLCLRSLERAQRTDAILYPFALTDADRFLNLTFVGSNGAVVPSAGGSTLVKGVAGDTFLERESKIALIKIDVEGHEPLALRGLRATIARHRPVILSEFHPKCLEENSHTRGEDFLAELRELGYSIAILERDRPGSETVCDSIDQVMRSWSEQNRALGASGEVHLDLVLRPA